MPERMDWRIIILVACATFIYFLSAGFLPDRLFVSIEVMKEEEKI